MKSFSARRIASACALSAATVAALVAPGAASAGSLGQQCSGDALIHGQGSSLQALAQQNVWTPEFNKSTVKSACSGKQGTKAKPEIKYNSSGSGTALKSWGAEEESKIPVEFGEANAYLGTDEPPNQTQIEEIESKQTASPKLKDTVETIPVAQGSVAIIVHLPEDCTSATSKAAVGRLTLLNKTLVGIFEGTINTWGQLETDEKAAGDKLSGTGCTPASDAITPVVRFDQSGTTHIFKRYLNLIDSSSLEVEGGGHATWGELSEGALNTVWPAAAKVQRPAEKGGSKEVAKVAATPGSVGYANLADARNNEAFRVTEGEVKGTGGAGTATFWVELQNSKKEKENTKHVIVTTYTYADPSSDKETKGIPQLANCKDTVYSNGTEAEFPPPSVYAPWNEVTTQLESKTYSLCGLTYDVAFSGYRAYPGTNLGEATDVNNYLTFVTEAAGGQKLIEAKHDYLGLPKASTTLLEAQAGAAEVNF
jgi:ABC-type phosphate transport system substrate-binding protein